MIPLLLLAAILPRAYDPAAAPNSSYVKVPKPGIRFGRMSDATATRSRWVDANGFRFERGVRKAFYDELPRGSAALAAAEAFAYDVEAVLKIDPADQAAFDKMLSYLKSVEAPAMPLMANIGIIDDGSNIALEAMNLLARKNLLYRPLKAADPKLDLNVKPTKEDAANPNEYAARLREKLTDEKRLLRVYGSDAVIARLTGVNGRARLHLLNYGRQPVKDLRIRLKGGDWNLISAGVVDVDVQPDAIEFSLPELETYAVVDLASGKRAESKRVDADFDLNADPLSPAWRSAPSMLVARDFLNKPIAGAPMEVRTRWSNGNLYFLYICPFDELNLKPNPQTSQDTDKLWDWDVAEAFVGSDFNHTGHYAEFEVSPQGEWVDLDIDRDHPKQAIGESWNSKFESKARIDREHRVWYAEMKIPFAALGVSAPKPGTELRLGLYRCAGKAPNRTYYAWSPTGKRTFHAPEAFGILRLE